MLDNCVEQFENNTILMEKKNGKYYNTTYKQANEQIEEFSKGLFALGLKKGERVALLCEGRNDWLISELAILSCGAINVPLSVKLDAESELLFRIKHSGARYIITSGGQLSKIRSISTKLEHVEAVIVLDDLEFENSKETSKSQILELAKSLSAYKEKEWYDTRQSITKNDIANISYTSGTTADPKGILLSHRNYVANVEQAASLMTIPPHYKTLAILPWDHAFAHTACLYSFMYFGAAIASIDTGKSAIETLKNIPINIKEVKPHILMSVPALAKNFRKNIENGIRAKGEKTEKLFQFALKIAYKYNKEGYNKGSKGTFIYLPLLRLFDKILFSKIRESFGGNLTFFIGGGALLDIELQRFFYAIGIPMFQGYGLSEASPVISSNGLAKHKLGSSGYLVNQMELKIVDDNNKELPVGQKGEIIIKGDNVMLGYWNNASATSETIKDGWLYTGDLGYLDADGFLYVLGRFKSLLISSDGEKYSPEGIEEALVDTSDYIDQAMLYNNQNLFTVALVVPSKSALLRFLKQKQLKENSEEALDVLLQLVNDEVSKFKVGGVHAGMFPSRWIPTNILIVPQAFTEENKLLNSTLKMVRGKIEERYKDDIDFLYTAEAKTVTNAKNREYLRKLLGGM